MAEMAWIGLGLMTLGGLAGWILRGHHQWARGSGVVFCHDVHADPNVLPPSGAVAGSATPTLIVEQREELAYEAGLEAGSATPTERVGCITPDGEVMRGHFGPCESADHRPIYMAAAGSATPTGDEEGG